MIVVARRSLGTLNHTLLTLEVARHRGLRVRGVVVNETAPVEARRTARTSRNWRGGSRCPSWRWSPTGRAATRGKFRRLAGVDWWSLIDSRI